MVPPRPPGPSAPGASPVRGSRGADELLEPSVDRVPYPLTTLGALYEHLPPLPVVVLLESVRSLYNVGAFFRTADAVGLDRLLLGGITAAPPRREITKTALGAEETVPWSRVEQPSQALDELRERGFEVAAVETQAHAVDLFDWVPRFPVCVVFGHEVEGITPRVLERCDTSVRIPMRGRKHSLNVATAGGVVLFELLRKYRRAFAEDRNGQRGAVVRGGAAPAASGWPPDADEPG